MTGIDPTLRQRIGALARAGQLLVALDFDGTLAPFVQDPSEARPLRASARAIAELAALDDTDVALVSGRHLDGLRSVASPGEDILLVGSHGAEHWAPESFEAEATDALLSPQQRRSLDAALAAVEAVAAAHGGLRVEPKPAGVVLHTRGTDDATAHEASKAADAALSDLPGVHVTLGHGVVEAGVLEANKGSGVRWLREITDASVVLYVGDDRTDEDAFAALESSDIGVKVGGGNTLARYRVDGPGDVAELLEYLVSVRD